MLVQRIVAEGSVLCAAGVVVCFIRGRAEKVSNDHLAERERESERDLSLHRPYSSEDQTWTHAGA